MRRVLAVYDVDPFYADRFAEVVNQKEKTVFSVMAFTSIDRLKEYAAKNPVEILLISESVSAEEADKVGAEQVIVLSDGEKGLIGGTYPSIYKYQSSADILREVMACYCENPKEDIGILLPSHKNVIGIYSPISRCLKTSFAITLGQLMAQDQSVLYINLEEYSGLKSLLGQEYQGDLSDLMYYYRQGSYNSLRLGAVVHSLGNMDYIPPARYPEDFTQMGAGDMANMISAIMEGSSYETLIVDTGHYGRQVLPILEICHVVYMPVKDDMISQAKVAAFEEYLEIAGHEEVRERIKKLKLPSPSGIRNRGNYMEQLIWGELGDYVRQLIGGGNPSLQ